MRKLNKDVELFRVKKTKKKGVRYRKWQKKQLWLHRVERLPAAKRKSYLKHARRMQRYAERGQLKDGVFFCKSGKEINQARIEKYTPMCHKLVRDFLPALALWEASAAYDDLINQAKIEVFLAILNGFCPVKAFTSRLKDPEAREASIAKKKANPQETLRLSEQSMVYGRLESWLKRLTWKYHPNQLGGRCTSLDSMMESINQEFSRGIFTLGRSVTLQKDSRVEAEKNRLLDILEIDGAEAAAYAFHAMHPATQRALSDLLHELSNMNSLGLNAYEDEPEKEEESV